MPFVWKAKFSDGSLLYQFDENNIEHCFQEVLDNKEKLVLFALYNKDIPVSFTVDLVNGIIYNNNCQPPQPELIVPKTNIKLLYFKRKLVEICGNYNYLQTIYFLRLNYIDSEGNCQIRYFQFDENGNFSIGV